MRIKPKAVFLWHLKEKDSFKTIHDQNIVLPDDELITAKDC